MSTIHGTNGADTLSGTSGNDLLLGDIGNDVYRFGIGSGQDTIFANANNQSLTTVGASVIEFGSGITPADLVISSALSHGGRAEDMLIQIAGTQDTLLVVSQFDVVSKFTVVKHAVTLFKFADGQTLSASDVQHLMSSGADYFVGSAVGYTAPDVVNGGAGQDTLDGSGGKDTLSGGAGDDLIRSGLNYYEGGHEARLSGDAGDDVILANWNSGPVTVSGGAGDDFIQAEPTPYSTSTAPTVQYEYSRGFGADTLDSGTVYVGTTVAARTIVFDATIQAADVEVYTPAAGGRVLRIKGTTDSITLQNVDATITFADGSTWTAADITAHTKASALTTGDDVYGVAVGTAAATYNGLDGNDILVSSGADTLLGGLGRDMLRGGDGAILNGGEGDDTLLAGSGPWFTGRGLTLDGGAGNDMIKGGYLSTLIGGDGNDTLLGYDGSVLDGGAGDDLLRTVRAGSVTYKVDRLSGHDTIAAAEFIKDKAIGLASDDPSGYTHTQTDAPDTIEFAADIAPEDVQIQAASGGYLISVRNSTATVFVETPPDGLKPWTFKFAGTGAVISGVDLGKPLQVGTSGSEALTGGAGSQQLFGLGGNDTLDGGAGDDLLSGGAGLDEYRFGQGWGHDTVAADADAATTGARIVFGDTTLGDAQLAAHRVGANDLVLQHTGSDDSVTLSGFFDATGLGQATGALVTLANGHSFTAAQLAALANAGSAWDDQLQGTAGADQINALAGHDVVEGGMGNDVISGGDGNDTLYAGSLSDLAGQSDTLSGGEGDDVLYGGSVLDGGAGYDTITATGNATINGGAGDDMIWTSAAATTVVSLNRGGGADRVRLTAAGGKDMTAAHTIEVDASVLSEDLWVRMQVENINYSLQGYPQLLTVAGTNDSVLVDTGWSVHFQSDGTTLSSADVINRANKYMGFVQGTDAAEQLVAQGMSGGIVFGGGGNDTLNGEQGYTDDVLSGDAGDDVLYGLAGNDTLRGGIGNDYLDGGAGNDTYRFMRGWGADTIVADSGDTILLGTDVLKGDVSFQLVGDKVVMSVAGTTDSLTLLNPSQWSGLQLKFGDGQVMTGSQIGAQVGLVQPINGGAGNDVLTGTSGNDTINGAAGNDDLSGGDGADTLTGGTGNDTVTGGLGADSYVFAAGDGQDTVHADAQDKLVLTGLSRANLVIGKLGATASDTVVLSFSGNTTDRLTIDKASQLNGFSLKFDDGSTLAWSDVMAIAAKPTDLSLTGTSGKDTLTGQDGNDTLSGLAGNDSLSGGKGADWLDGGQGADTLSGGQGNDTLLGGTGGDTYLFGRGDGKDTIFENDGTWFVTDTLKFGADVASKQLWFKRVGTSLEIDVIGTSDSVTIQDWYQGSAYRVEKITAGDGKSLSASKVDALVSAMASFSPPAAGQTTLPADTPASLTKVIASSWS